MALPSDIRLFQIEAEEGPDAPGWYGLVREQIYLGPWPSEDEATQAMVALIREYGSVQALLDDALTHTRRTARGAGAATRFLGARRGKSAH